ncbi:MAG: isoprenyl transferase [Clostridia bacterium]|nr:isoprenyl transferase [Clostridia bacterium]
MKSNKNFPSHVAIIMDGNGRWATRRKMSRLAGHRQGVEAIKRIIACAGDFDIKILTFFAFSTENWKRDKAEVDGIFDIVRSYLDGSLEELDKNNVKITVMGDITRLPQDLCRHINLALAKTQNNTGLIVNLAINYGARDEIVRAVNMLIDEGEQISADDISAKLYSKDLPDPDFIIRTSGEKRLSNFMLYQAAYSELYFTKVFWPSFGKRHLKRALKNYSRRERRYGGNHK